LVDIEWDAFPALSLKGVRVHPTEMDFVHVWKGAVTATTFGLRAGKRTAYYEATWRNCLLQIMIYFSSMIAAKSSIQTLLVP
jgi:hypothetical protein